MSHRREQLASSIQRIVGQIITEGLADPRISGLISVTHVDVTPDFQQARVYVSVLPAERQRASLRGLQHAQKHVHAMVSDRLRVRSVPKLLFELDESLKKQASVLDAIREAVESDELGEGEGGAEASEPGRSDTPSAHESEDSSS